MAAKKSFHRKVAVLALMILLGVGPASASGPFESSDSADYASESIEFIDETFDDDSFLSDLLEEIALDHDEELNDEDWELFLKEEGIDLSLDSEVLFGSDANSAAPRTDQDLRLLPLNKSIYDHVTGLMDWTRQVKVSTSQKKQAPVVLGDVWSRKQLQETHPSGVRITKEKPSLSEGEAAVAASKAEVKSQETLEFGLPYEDDHPLSGGAMETWVKSHIFDPVSKPSAEPFRLAVEEGHEPFDEDASEMNVYVFEHNASVCDETLIAQAEPADLPASPETSQQNRPTESVSEPTKAEDPDEPPLSPPENSEDSATEPPPKTTPPQSDPQTEDEAPAQPELPPGEKEIKLDEPKASEEVIEEEPQTPEEPPLFLIKFNNVQMAEYVSFVSRITGKNFVFDPADLNFNVTIISDKATTVENIISALLQELRFRGLSMVEVGNNIIIHRQLGINSPAEVVPEGQQPPTDSEIVTQVYRISNADPSAIATIIRPMLSANAVIEPISDTGHLIVTGLRSNINRISELISNIDAPDAGLEIGQYQAQNIPIKRALSIAEELIAPIAKDRPIVLTPLSDRNVVYIVSTPGLVSQAIAIFEKIDSNEQLPPTRFDSDASGRPILRQEFEEERDLTIEEKRQKELQKQREEEAERARIRRAQAGRLGDVEATKFYIHKLQYRQGDQIQQALQSVANSLQQVTEQNEDNDLISTINSVQWIESSNSLIFTGTSATLEKIKELIDELDTALPQVLVEVLVLEVSVEDSLTFGVDWGTRFRSLNAAGAQAFLSENSTLPAALDTTIPSETINNTNLSRLQGFNLGVIGRVISRNGCDFTSIGAIVSAIHVDQRIDVLLNPRIVIEDNTTAEFFVGINTPFLTQSIANEFGNIITGNFEFRDIGSTIKITPLIGNNGIITLDIEQEISNVVATNQLLTGAQTGTAVTITAGGEVIPDGSAVGGGQGDIGPTTRKSSTKTRVHMPDGYFLILSGQIRDEKDYTVTQIPCIGGLPWIGSLFSQRANRLDKRNLMIFIRPQIIDIERINPVTKRQQDIWLENKRDRKRWEYEVDEALEWFNVKEPYCAPEERRLRY